MAQEKDGFGDDNEISRFEDEEETGAGREEIVEADQEELTISERPGSAGLSEISGGGGGGSRKKSKSSKKSKAKAKGGKKKAKAKSKSKSKSKSKTKAKASNGRGSKRGKRR